MSPTVYHVLGLMSGTSLDGVDLAHCICTLKDEFWTYEIGEAETIAYSPAWKNALIRLENTDAFSFQQIHTEYGFYLGDLVAGFIEKHQLSIDFVASHGHTIFHRAFKKSELSNYKAHKLTVQVGAGSAIAAQAKLPVVCDFRSLDVALGGEGAPLVPIGDKFLFAEFDFCLNLGGFANVSYQHDNKRVAYDICPVNLVMNAICVPLGKEFDSNGELAKSGALNSNLLEELNALPFYQLPANSPKSLGKEWVMENINPLLEKYKLDPASVLKTFCEHVAIQVAGSLNDKPIGKLLITGGGTFNAYLMERIKKHSAHQLCIPDKKTIEFKEALIFAFLGILRMRNEVNCLKSVTGAKQDNVGGAVYHN